MHKFALSAFAFCVYVFCFWTLPFPHLLVILLPLAVLRDWFLYFED